MNTWGTLVMLQHKYGEFTDKQMSEIKHTLRKKIYFLLLVAEDTDCSKFPDVNILEAHTSLLWLISGLNELLGEPPEIVTVLSLLEEAKNMIANNFDFSKYRKLILDAGAKVQDIPETDGGVADES